MKYYLAAVLFLLQCKSIATKIEIDAPADKVWAEFRAFEKYPEWNPFLRIGGNPTMGEKLAVKFHRGGEDWFEMEPRVLESSDCHLVWRGRLLMPGIFTGEHEFRFEKAGEGRTIFYHNENFNGLIVPFFPLGETEKKFAAMNAALKQRAEYAAGKSK